MGSWVLSAIRRNIVIGLIVTSFNGYTQNTIITNVKQFSQADSQLGFLLFNDDLRGGMFVYDRAQRVVDNGIVFPAKDQGVWVRVFNRADGVNPCWWGAKGDGIQDDLNAINAATKYCLSNQVVLKFPSGIFRITKTWIIGGKSLDEEYLLEAKLTNAEGFDMQQHSVARKTTPLIIRGSTNTCIYGDFQTNKRTAIVYYNIKGNGLASSPSNAQYSHEFSNIGIYGYGSYENGKYLSPKSVSKSSSQIGLAVVYNSQITIEGCNFSNLDYGLLFHTTYFSSIQNTHFEWCNKGLTTISCNANIISNIVGYYCKEFVDINGSQFVLNNVNSEYCETSLLLKGRNIVVNGAYCENHNLKLPNRFQIIIGRNSKDVNYGPKSATAGIVLSGITLTAGGRDLILLEEDSRDVQLSAANINGNIVTKSKRPGLQLTNVIGSYKLIGSNSDQKN